MRKRYLIILFLIINPNIFAECIDFKIYNNTNSTLIVREAHQAKVKFCEFLPLFINKHSVVKISVQAPKFLDKTVFYISFENHDYDLFEEFSVDAVGVRELDEELIGKNSAYSWSSNLSKVYLCNVLDYKKHQTCNFSYTAHE